MPINPMLYDGALLCKTRNYFVKFLQFQKFTLLLCDDFEHCYSTLTSFIGSIRLL